MPSPSFSPAAGLPSADPPVIDPQEIAARNIKAFLWFRVLFNSRFYYPIFTSIIHAILNFIMQHDFYHYPCDFDFHQLKLSFTKTVFYSHEPQ